MTISLEQYRVAVGIFNGHGSSKRLVSDLYFWSFIFPNFMFHNFVLPTLCLLAGDIELNPGPNDSSGANENVIIGHANVRSLMAHVPDPNELNHSICKFELVKQHVLYYGYHLFGISETWLDNSIDDTDLTIAGYVGPLRRDISRHQRGTAVYISDNIPAKHRPDLEPQRSEIICVEIQLRSQKILICNCYRAPASDMIDFCLDVDNLIDTANAEFHDIIIMGDLNARNTLFWNQDITNSDGRILNACFEAHNFLELIAEPTRTSGSSKSCIDLLFTKHPDIFNEVGTRDKIAPICDHNPIYGILTYSVKRHKCYKRWIWNFKRGDYDRLNWLLLNAQ